MDATLFNIERLAAENYEIWSMRIEAYLEAKDLYEDIVEKDPPTEEDAEIAQLGKSLTDRELVRYIIEGLPPYYDPVVIAILINRNIKFIEPALFVKKPGHLKKECWFNKENNRQHRQNGPIDTQKPQPRKHHRASLAKEFALCAITRDNTYLVEEGTKGTKKDGRSTSKTVGEKSIMNTHSKGDENNSNFQDVSVVPELCGDPNSVTKKIEKENKVILSQEGRIEESNEHFEDKVPTSKEQVTSDQQQTLNDEESGCESEAPKLVADVEHEDTRKSFKYELNCDLDPDGDSSEVLIKIKKKTKEEESKKYTHSKKKKKLKKKRGFRCNEYC
ncbi:uncharacterized protein [Halyomorpha halys]|uniref:uncharacterized protein n=1 Tax=Halyomorpha halys TaxID=286706 RepID=UPI0034D30866